jgi:SanA protein
MKKKIILIVKLGISLALSVFIFNLIIIKSAKGLTFEDTNKIPKNKVGLVLGTGKFLANGHLNLYYKYRIDAAVALYKAGKVEFLLLSGDNGVENYDEPTTFKEDLIARGIPENNIFLDYAGFRTLDSVVRAYAVFGQEHFTIISQKFHNERAVFIANQKGLHAIGFNARAITGRYGLKVRVREYFARTKVFIDLLLNKKPKFLGKKITIE